MSVQIEPLRIAVVDDEEDILLAAKLLLKRHFASVKTYRDPALLPGLARANEFDLLLLDMNFTPGADSGGEGLRWLSEVLVADPQAVVVVITAHRDVDLAVRAMKAGAADFVVKPWENERLLATLTAAANLRRVKAEALDLKARNRGLALATQSAGEMIGSSPAMLSVFDVIRRSAPSSANVLILGENGVGKELVAREIHGLSARAGEVFLRVDLSSIAGALFESELFGHRRGSFTDAKEDRIGRFRAASGGTLFLDEIGTVPLHLQAKLLTALERREVVAVGSDRAEPIDVRLICATNLLPERLADETMFRADLLYRINTVEITLPPLRERKEDIPVLLEHFASLYAQKYNFPRKRITAAALDRLAAHSWPGNVRELRHAVERATILSESPVLDADDFLPGLGRAGALPQPQAPGSPLKLDAMERDAIASALQRHKGNVSRAAATLGLTRASLYRRIEKYGL
jgi:two-component system, NtrC family, response regulator HydG